MSNFLYVDDNINILTGKDAESALSAKNDKTFLRHSSGITTIPQNRWNEAQKAENTHWMKRGITKSNDRNHEHYNFFQQYQHLRGRTFLNAIELGCGPFTNLRIISTLCEIQNCILLDPLIENYLQHPNAYYNTKHLFGERVFNNKTANRIQNALFRRAPHLRSLLFKKSRISALMPHPIETMPANRSYDLVVMINVIEHCFDANAVLENILKITDKESIIVFSEKLYSEEDIQRDVNEHYESAHPIKIEKTILINFLHNNFQEIFSSYETTSYQVRDQAYCNDSIYFIGSRKT